MAGAGSCLRGYYLWLMSSAEPLACLSSTEPPGCDSGVPPRSLSDSGQIRSFISMNTRQIGFSLRHDTKAGIRHFIFQLMAILLLAASANAQGAAKDPSTRLREVLPADVAARVLERIAGARANRGCTRPPAAR